MTLLRLCTCGAKVRNPPCPKCRTRSNTRRRSRQNWSSVYNTPRWRRIRQFVLDRDGYTCQRGYAGCSRIATVAGHDEPFTGPDDPAAWDPDGIHAECLNCSGVEAGKRSRRRG